MTTPIGAGTLSASHYKDLRALHGGAKTCANPQRAATFLRLGLIERTRDSAPGTRAQYALTPAGLLLVETLP